MTEEIKTPAAQGKGRLSAVFGRHAPAGALARGLSHQLMCGGIMLAGHLLSGPVPVVGEVMARPETNIGLMGLAAFCWGRGSLDWHKLRGKLSRTWEKVAAHGVLAVAGAGMMYMHNPWTGMHSHGHHCHDHMHMQGAAEGGTPPNPQAQAWLDGLDPAVRKRVEDNAAKTGMALGEYTNTLCGLPPLPRAAAGGVMQHGR